MSISASGKNRPPIFVHYLPWFRKQGTIPSVSNWAHWHGYGENTPFACQELDTGYRKIASLDYPSRGPYSSNDPAIIDQHLSEIHAYGMNGVILDWYGIGEVDKKPIPGCDFYYVNSCCLEVVRRIKKFPDLRFLIFFDRNFENIIQDAVVGRRFLQKFDYVDYMKRSLECLNTQYLADAAYFKVDDRSLLMVFGHPQEPQVVDWTTFRTDVLPQKTVCLLTQDNIVPWSDGIFAWLPVLRGADVPNCSWDQVEQKLNDVHSRSKAENGKCQMFAGIAFPGIDDIYREDERAGSHCQRVDREGGKTLRKTLDLARSQDNAKLIQIATYNDWSEGTQIEPSVNYGTRELETIRQFMTEVTEEGEKS